MLVIQKKTGRQLGVCRDIPLSRCYRKPYATKTWPNKMPGWPTITYAWYRFKFIDWAQEKVAIIAHGLLDAVLLPGFVNFGNEDDPQCDPKEDYDGVCHCQKCVAQRRGYGVIISIGKR